MPLNPDRLDMNECATPWVPNNNSALMGVNDIESIFSTFSFTRPPNLPSNIPSNIPPPPTPFMPLPPRHQQMEHLNNRINTLLQEKVEMERINTGQTKQLADRLHALEEMRVQMAEDTDKLQRMENAFKAIKKADNSLPRKDVVAINKEVQTEQADEECLKKESEKSLSEKSLSEKPQSEKTHSEKAQSEKLELEKPLSAKSLSEKSHAELSQYEEYLHRLEKSQWEHQKQMLENDLSFLRRKLSRVKSQNETLKREATHLRVEVDMLNDVARVSMQIDNIGRDMTDDDTLNSSITNEDDIMSRPSIEVANSITVGNEVQANKDDTIDLDSNDLDSKKQPSPPMVHAASNCCSCQ